jgi:hypothetical protein
MNPIYDFSAVDHAAMLGDLIRLELYRRAIENQVKPDSVVVEVGTGSGILAAYAAHQTKNKVTAIEFAEYSAELARRMMKAAGFDHVDVVRGLSSDVTLSPEPTVLITETIGALGPEENIVEICYDFKKRHPAIQTFVPAKLRIYAEPIRSNQVVEGERNFFQSYTSASFGKFNFEAIQDDLWDIWTSRIRYRPLETSKSVGERVLLVEYVLGTTEKSNFSKEIDYSNLEDVDAVHLYFEAELDGETLLSTHYADPETHWNHAFVSRPGWAKRLTVSFNNPSPTLITEWK